MLYGYIPIIVRVVIGKQKEVAIMDIDSEQSTDYSEEQLSADTRQQAGETTSKVNSLILFRRGSEWIN